MATGYTYKVQDGTITTLKEFALICARAFGFCIDMKDDSLDKPIPNEFKEGYIYQDYINLDQDWDNIYSQVGLWMIGPEPHGIGIRENNKEILGNKSNFVPHVIE